MKNIKIFIILTISILGFVFSTLAQPTLDKKTAKEAWRKNYSYVDEFISGYARVNDIDGNVGMIDSLGKLVIPIKYASLGNVKYNMAVFTDKNDKYGLLNLKGDTILPCKYTLLYPDGTGKYVLFRENTDSMGMMNLKGKVIFPNIYTYIRPTSKPECFILCNAKNQFGFFTPSKEILALEYESINTSSEGKYIVAKRNGKVAILDFEGKIIVPYDYDNISLSTDNQTFIGKKNKKSAYLTIAQKELFPYQYETLSFPLANGSFIASEQGKYSIIDKKGTPLFPFEYDYIEQYTGVLTGSKGDSTDILFPNGKRFKNATASYFTLKNNQNRVAVVKSKKTGVFDLEGNEIYPFEFDYFEFFNNETVIIAKNKKYAFCNFSNIPKANYKYDALNTFNTDDNYTPLSYRAKKDNKMGIIDHNEHEIIPFEHDSLAIFDYDNANILTRKGEKFGIIDATNKVILPCNYDKIQRAFDTFFYAYKDNTKYLLNKKNKVLASSFLDYNYRQSVLKVGNFFYIENKEGFLGAIDEEGNIVLPFEYNFYLSSGNNFERDSIVTMAKGKENFYINMMQAKVVSEAYDQIVHFQKIKAVKKKGKFAFTDAATMKLLSEFIYDDVTRGILFPNSKNYMILSKKNGLYSILDSNLTVIKENMPYDTMFLEEHHTALIGKKGDRIDYLGNQLEKITIPQGFEFNTLAYDKFVIFRKQTGTQPSYDNKQVPIYKYGLADKNGKILHHALFDAISAQESGIYLHVGVNHGYLHKDATMWYDTIYNRIDIKSTTNYIILQKDNMYSVETKDGKIIFPFEYNHIEYVDYMFVMRKKVKQAAAPTQYPRNAQAKESKFEKIEAIEIDEANYQSEVFDNFYSNDFGYDIEKPEEVFEVRMAAPNEAKNEDKAEEKQEKKLVEVLKYGVVGEDKQEIIPFIYDKIEYSYDSRKNFIVVNNGLTGIIDKSGKVTIPTIYRSLEPCYYGCNSYDQRYIALKDELLGVLDYNNKIVVPFEYDRIIADQQNRGHFFVRKDGIDGKILPDGSENFPMTELQKKYNLYDGIRHGYMDDNILVVRRRWRWGFVNVKGEQLTPIKYSEVGNKYKNGSILVAINGKQGVVNNGKEVLPCEYDAVINVSADAKYFIVRNGNQFGLVNDKNEMTLYPDVGSIINNVKADFLGNNNNKQVQDKHYSVSSVKEGYAVVIEGGNYGLIDKQQNIHIPMEYEYLEIVTKELFIFAKKGNCGVINAKNKIVIPNLYDRIYFQNGKFFVIKNHLIGIYNINGKEIAPIAYQHTIFIDSKNIALVAKGNKINIIDENDKISEQEYKDVKINGNYLLLIDLMDKEIKLDGNYGITPNGYKFDYDEKKNLSIIHEKEKRKQLLVQNYEQQYEEIPTLSEGLICLKQAVENRGDLHGYMNPNGQWIIAPKYNYAKPFKNGFAIVGNWRQYTFINHKEEEITSFDFNQVGDFTPEGIAPVSIDSKVGLINTKGEIVVPFIYYNPNYQHKFEFENGLLPVRLTKESGIHVYINTKGEIIFK